MLAKRPLVGNSFSAVGAGQTATVDLNANGTYDALFLHYQTGTAGGATKVNVEAEVQEIRLKVNGKVQRRFSATELNIINSSKGSRYATIHGDASDVAVLPCFFAEPWRRASQGEDALAWGMADVDNFQLEIDIASGAVSPVLAVQSLWAPDKRTMGPIVKWKKYSVGVTTTGVREVTTFNKSDAYYALHCSTDDIDKIVVKLDQEIMFERTHRENGLLLAGYGGVQQSGWFNCRFDFDSRVTSVLGMTRADKVTPVSEFRVDFDMGAATSFNVISETLGLRD